MIHIPKEKPDAWDSGLATREPCILLSDRVRKILKTIQDEVGNDEYSVLFKGDWESKGFTVSNNYYIPKQEISSMSVDYEENIGKLRNEKGYNVICHSHPFSSGTGNYSGADDSHINSHFPCSILTDKHGDIINATLKLDTSHVDCILSIKIDPKNIEELDIEPDEDILKYQTKIKELQDKIEEISIEKIVGMDNINYKWYNYKKDKHNSQGNFQLSTVRTSEEIEETRKRLGFGTDMKYDNGIWRKKSTIELAMEKDDAEWDKLYNNKTYSELCQEGMGYE